MGCMTSYMAHATYTTTASSSSSSLSSSVSSNRVNSRRQSNPITAIQNIDNRPLKPKSTSTTVSSSTTSFTSEKDSILKQPTAKIQQRSTSLRTSTSSSSSQQNARSVNAFTGTTSFKTKQSTAALTLNRLLEQTSSTKQSSLNKNYRAANKTKQQQAKNLKTELFRKQTKQQSNYVQNVQNREPTNQWSLVEPSIFSLPTQSSVATNTVSENSSPSFTSDSSTQTETLETDTQIEKHEDSPISIDKLLGTRLDSAKLLKILKQKSYNSANNVQPNVKVISNSKNNLSIKQSKLTERNHSIIKKTDNNELTKITSAIQLKSKSNFGNSKSSSSLKDSLASSWKFENDSNHKLPLELYVDPTTNSITQAPKNITSFLPKDVANQSMPDNQTEPPLNYQSLIANYEINKSSSDSSQSNMKIVKHQSMNSKIVKTSKFNRHQSEDFNIRNQSQCHHRSSIADRRRQLHHALTMPNLSYASTLFSKTDAQNVFDDQVNFLGEHKNCQKSLKSSSSTNLKIVLEKPDELNFKSINSLSQPISIHLPEQELERLVTASSLESNQESDYLKIPSTVNPYRTSKSSSLTMSQMSNKFESLLRHRSFLKTMTSSVSPNLSKRFFVHDRSEFDGSSQVLQIIKKHSNGVNCLELSEDQSLLVSGGEDGILRLWSTFSTPCECIGILIGHSDYITCCTVYRLMVISGSADKTIKLWSIEDGNCMMTLLGHTSFINRVVCYGPLLLSSSFDGTVRVWTLTDRLTMIQNLKSDGSIDNEFVLQNLSFEDEEAQDINNNNSKSRTKGLVRRQTVKTSFGGSLHILRVSIQDFQSR